MDANLWRGWVGCVCVGAPPKHPRVKPIGDEPGQVTCSVYSASPPHSSWQTAKDYQTFEGNLQHQSLKPSKDQKEAQNTNAKENGEKSIGNILRKIRGIALIIKNIYERLLRARNSSI